MSNSTEDRSMILLTWDEGQEYALEGQYMPTDGLRVRVACDGTVEFCMRCDDEVVVAEFSERCVQRLITFLQK